MPSVLDSELGLGAVCWTALSERLDNQSCVPTFGWDGWGRTCSGGHLDLGAAPGEAHRPGQGAQVVLCAERGMERVQRRSVR